MIHQDTQTYTVCDTQPTQIHIFASLQVLLITQFKNSHFQLLKKKCL